MIVDTLLAKVIGTANDRELKRIRPMIAEINAQEPETQRLSDEELRRKTIEFRERLANGESRGQGRVVAEQAGIVRGFQSGPYASADNAEALACMEQAQAALQRRTRARMARGVEGTHTV